MRPYVYLIFSIVDIPMKNNMNLIVWHERFIVRIWHMWMFRFIVCLWLSGAVCHISKLPFHFFPFSFSSLLAAVTFFKPIESHRAYTLYTWKNSIILVSLQRKAFNSNAWLSSSALISCPHPISLRTNFNVTNYFHCMDDGQMSIFSRIKSRQLLQNALLHPNGGWTDSLKWKRNKIKWPMMRGK